MQKFAFGIIKSLSWSLLAIYGWECHYAWISYEICNIKVNGKCISYRVIYSDLIQYLSHFKTIFVEHCWKHHVNIFSMPRGISNKMFMFKNYTYHENEIPSYYFHYKTGSWAFYLGCTLQKTRYDIAF